jgi:hypothetical protein
MSTPEHPIERLRRADRHSLGAGDGVQFAPPHPRWLHRPAFWDGVQWYAHVLRPAFALAILDGSAREIVLRESFRSWTPAMLVTNFIGAALQLTERRVVLEGGRIASDCTLANGSGTTERLTIAIWTALEGADVPDRAACFARPDGALAFRTSVAHAQHRSDRLFLDAVLGLDPPADFTLLLEAQRARGSENTPDWNVAPFLAALREPAHAVRSLADKAGAAGRTLVYLGLFRRTTLEPGEAFSFTATLEIAPQSGQLHTPVPLDATAAASETSGATAQRTPVARAPTVQRAAVARAGGGLRPAEESNHAWQRFFESAPDLISSDAHISRFFAHRWYGLRLNFLAPVGMYRHPTCAEGTEFFHEAISYSAWTHARELRWLDVERARGVLATFFDHQKEDGSIPGIVYGNGVHQTASYFADWGGSLDALQEVQPDRIFLERAARSLARYAAWLGRVRDPDATGLYRVLDPYETGQEYMSRYTAVDAHADAQHFDYALDLFGVDVTVYAYRLHRALARAAAVLDQRESRRAHDRTADRIGDAIRERMWDPRSGLFSDIDPQTGKRTGVKAAVCFYPWLTDIAGPEHVAGLERNLFDSTSFWTPFPVPSTAADDPTFDADGYWKGVRRNCPWNGRVWPMTNCHVADALARTAVTHAPHLRERAADLILRTVRMMFFDGDPARPNSFEHYSPLTGEPCTYRGLDDYQHSWVNDLLVRWIIGFRPTDDGFLVDPLPSAIDNARLERLPFRGNRLTVGFDSDRVFATWQGQRVEALRGTVLYVPAASVQGSL